MDIDSSVSCCLVELQGISYNLKPYLHLSIEESAVYKIVKHLKKGPV